jgi:hypothetical protein
MKERPRTARAISGIFYVFAIWIGFGVYALYESAQNIYKKVAGPIIIVVY